MNAQPIHITVKAVPVDSLATQYMVECSDCGPVEVVADTQADERCLIHLEKHEVDTGPFRQEMK